MNKSSQMNKLIIECRGCDKTLEASSEKWKEKIIRKQEDIKFSKGRLSYEQWPYFVCPSCQKNRNNELIDKLTRELTSIVGKNVDEMLTEYNCEITKVVERERKEAFQRGIEEGRKHANKN